MASAATAAERGYSVTSFDRIRVEGPFLVTLTTGKAVSAKASGSSAALERVSVRVEGRTIIVRPNMSGWGGYPGRQDAPARIMLTTPGVHTATLLGSGRLDIDRVKAPRVMLAVEGSGRIGVGAVEADNLSLGVSGSGGIEAAGRVKLASVMARGVGEIRAPDLKVADLTLTSETAGAVVLNATRSARVSVTGVGPVEVQGTAACEVKKVGSGPISCGR